MADKQVQIRKGTTAQNNAFTGALGELSFDTQQNRLRTHDGVTAGGFPHALSSEVAERVLRSGDTMTGGLSINSNIALNADGTAGFDGDVDIGVGAVHLDSAPGAGGISTFGSGIFLYHDSGIIEGNDVFCSAVDVLAGIILLNSDGSAQFAGGQITISNLGAVNVNLNTSLNIDGSVAFGTSGLFTISAAGVIGFPDNVRQTFNPGANNAGLNVGSVAGDPSTPSNGDIWYDSTANELTARINGSNVALGAGGSTPPFSDTGAIIMGSADNTKLLRFEVDGFTTATTRVLTPQNASYIIAGTNIVNSFTVAQAFDGDNGLSVGSMLITDPGSAGLLTIDNGGVDIPNGGLSLGARLSTFVDDLVDGANIATDAALANHFRVVLGGNRTLDNPTNAYDGARVVWEFVQDGTGNRTITLGDDFTFGTDITGVTLSTAANARDFMTAIYNAAADEWHVVAFVKGY